MAYAIYTTEAIVCGSYAQQTSDKSYLLFTREAGMLYATARSVREERSRQRYALQDFSLIRVSLVKGKSGWRIGSVEALGNPFLEAHNRTARAGVAYIVKIIRRYIQGETSLPQLFDETTAAITYAAAVGTPEAQARYQQVFVFRLLTTLGYVAPAPVLVPLLSAPSVERALQVYDSKLTALIDTHIVQAQTVSHL